MNTKYKYAEILGDNTIAENREDASFIWDNYYDEEEQINEYDLALFIPEDCQGELLYRKYEETHYQRAYELETVKRLLEEAGMEFLAVYDAFTREEPKKKENKTGRDKMGDYIVRATAANSQIRAFAATTRDLVEYARAAHNTSPVATAALGRLLTGGAMMGVMMKGEKDLLTLQVKAGGPLNGMTVTADSRGNVKGYVGNPNVVLHANDKGKLDVAGAVGVGFMNVIKDMGLKEPYMGQTVLQTSEIAEDLTYYFATSEQVPSSVGLGVLMEKDNTVKQAGGFIIQLMPFTEESVISQLEENLKNVTSVTALLEEGHTPESLLETLLKGFDIEFTEKIPTQFYCNCSKERVERALISVGKKDIQEMIDDGKEIEMNCHFCNKNYIFTVDELKRILKECKR